jgi:hypothetical protein
MCDLPGSTMKENAVYKKIVRFPRGSFSNIDFVTSFLLQTCGIFRKCGVHVGVTKCEKFRLSDKIYQ